jgi:hypothetical protein
LAQEVNTDSTKGIKWEELRPLIVLLFLSKNGWNEINLYISGSLLSAGNLTAFAGCLPVSTNLQPIYDRGHRKARFIERNLDGVKANWPLPSLGWAWF